jgi:hypothetical protein
MWKSEKRQKFPNLLTRLLMVLPVRRETKHLHWMTLRSGVTAGSDTLLTATTSKAADIPSHAIKIAQGINIAELRFLADADGRSCTGYIHVARKNDDVSLVCSVAITAGQQAATDGRFYADSLIVTNSWYLNKGIKLADADGNNRMARMAFDILGYDDLFVLLDISSGTWGVDITGL